MKATYKTLYGVSKEELLNCLRKELYGEVDGYQQELEELFKQKYGTSWYDAYCRRFESISTTKGRAKKPRTMD